MLCTFVVRNEELVVIGIESLRLIALGGQGLILNSGTFDLDQYEAA